MAGKHMQTNVNILPHMHIYISNDSRAYGAWPVSEQPRGRNLTCNFPFPVLSLLFFPSFLYVRRHRDHRNDVKRWFVQVTAPRAASARPERCKMRCQPQLSLLLDSALPLVLSTTWEPSSARPHFHTELIQPQIWPFLATIIAALGGASSRLEDGNLDVP